MGHGGQTDASWAPFVRYAGPWIAFLNEFADALHAHNLTLSVDIAACCGWVDSKAPDQKHAAGHCVGAFSTHEFVATTCEMYKTSRLDRVYGMGTYSTSINGPPGNENHREPSVGFEMMAAAQKGLGVDKY